MLMQNLYIPIYEYVMSIYTYIYLYIPIYTVFVRDLRNDAYIKRDLIKKPTKETCKPKKETHVDAKRTYIYVYRSIP